MIRYPADVGWAEGPTVKGVFKAGSIPAILGCEHTARWSTIGSVVAGVAASGGGELFVIALDVDDGAVSRVFTVAESERIAGNRTDHAELAYGEYVDNACWLRHHRAD